LQFFLICLKKYLHSIGIISNSKDCSDVVAPFGITDGDRVACFGVQFCIGDIIIDGSFSSVVAIFGICICACSD
jgi:uncharacterized Rossmann fold enzyme